MCKITLLKEYDPDEVLSSWKRFLRNCAFQEHADSEVQNSTNRNAFYCCQSLQRTT